MLGKRIFHMGISIFLGIFIVGIVLGVINQAQASLTTKNKVSFTTAEQTITGMQQAMYLPLLLRNYPWSNMFGVESTIPFVQGNAVLSNTIELPTRWVRLNDRISWRSLQPEEGDLIEWEKLAGFEEELRLIKSAGMEPIIVVDGYPRWATDNSVREDGQPTDCGRLLEDKVDDFAVFMSELVNRYKTLEFDVHNWELGNEPDVDPNSVPPDNQFGCWGDIADPYYGGEAYGRMIIQVGRAIKASDPSAQVWLGGLLLDSPNTTDPDLGHPELFFEGILRSGAAPFFDVVPYHFYTSYGYEAVRDFDIYPAVWADWGGGTVGKARYLRQVMQTYGVSKPVFLNETSFLCPYDANYPDKYRWCKNPSQDFYDLQADHVVRSATRAYSENIMGYIWYTMNGPGWRWGGLLDSDQATKPVYRAYAQMIFQYRNSRPLGAVSYATEIEAYAFDRGSNRLDVLWSIDDETITVTVPISDWLGTFGSFGDIITPTINGTNYLLPIGYDPVYLVRRP